MDSRVIRQRSFHESKTMYPL